MSFVKGGFLLRFFPALVLCLFILIQGCKENSLEQVEDVEYLSYLAYKKIFNEKDKVSLDSTRVRLQNYLKLYPTDSRGYTFYARVLYETDQLDSSVVAYRQAFICDSLYTGAYSGLGALYTILHRNDSAEYYLMKAIRLKDSSPYTFLNLSMLYLNKGEQKQSFAYADSAYIKADSLPAIDAGLCLVYHLQNQKEKSETMFERAVALGLKDTVMFKEVLRGEIKIEDYYRHNNY